MNKIKMDLTKELPYAVEESINRLRINVSFLGNEIKKILNSPIKLSVNYDMSN